MTREEFEQARAAGIKWFEWRWNRVMVLQAYDDGDVEIALDKRWITVCITELKPIYDKPDVVCEQPEINVLNKCKKCGYETPVGMQCDNCNTFAYGCFEKEFQQTAKADAGKPRLSLVPTQIIHDIAAVREYGTAKYGDPENWRQVELQRYVDAAYRHWIEFVKDQNSRDEESGLLHIQHAACNVAFICELMEGQKDEI